VSRDQIVDLLWADRPPRTCLSLVHDYVRQLRRLLEPERTRGSAGRTLVRANLAYRLQLAPHELDVLSFDDFVARARRADAAGDPDTALDLYARALLCWRQPVLSGLDPQMRRHPAAVAIAGRRVSTALAHADLAIRLSRADEAVARLRDMVDDEPLHEGMQARLMLALAGSGQQGAALAVFAEVRQRLANDLGIEPGPELATAHLRVLRQDVPAAGPAAGGPGEASAPPGGVPAQLPADVAAFTGRHRPTWLPRPHQVLIERRQGDVGQQRREDPALRVPVSEFSGTPVSVITPAFKNAFTRASTRAGRLRSRAA
jgi:DNA-binding SARP family transcriptional activator